MDTEPTVLGCIANEESMRRLLVINPNTSTRISKIIESLVRDEAAGEADVLMATAPFGFSYISTRVAVSIAAHAVLDAAAEALAKGAAPDAILLACFGDPGREALAELTGLPVIGFAEAGLLAAAALPGTSLVATNGAVWCEMLSELILKLGIVDKIVGVRSIEEAGDEPDAIAGFLAREAKATGAARVVLGGAGLIPSLPQIIAAAHVPIIDPHREAVRKALRLAASPQTAMLPSISVPNGVMETFGLSPVLSAALRTHNGAERKH